MDNNGRVSGPQDLSRILHDDGSSARAEREKRRLDRAPFDYVSPLNLKNLGAINLNHDQQPRDRPSLVHIQSGKVSTSVLLELPQFQENYDRSLQSTERQRGFLQHGHTRDIENSERLGMSHSRKATKDQIHEPCPDPHQVEDRDREKSKLVKLINHPQYVSAVSGSLFCHGNGQQIKIANESLLRKQIPARSELHTQISATESQLFRQTLPVLGSSSISNMDVLPGPHATRKQPSLGAPSQFTNLPPADLFGRSGFRRGSTQVGLSNKGPAPLRVPDLVYKRLLINGQLHFIPTRAPKDVVSLRPTTVAASTDPTATNSIVAAPGTSSVTFKSPPDIFFTKKAEQKEEETSSEFRARLTYLFGQMMFVSGETAEPSAETTWMIEEIVREQVLEMLKEATILANRRGSKSISIVDLIFQIRHNTAKVSRLKTFLSWKDVRKNVKDSDDKAGADADALDLEDAAGPGANPAAPQKTTTNKKAKLILPWETQSYYSEQVPEREDEEDEEEEEQNEATLARLASADERTRNMTRDEYVYWSDCRQASFSFRKGKRFREWAGFGTIIDSKPNDDVVDILGFLTFEIVQTLTEEALKVKNSEDLRNKKASIGRGEEASKKRKREVCTLFEMPEEGRTPVEPRHVREAFRILQIVPPKYKFMRQGYAGIRTPLRMI